MKYTIEQTLVVFYGGYTPRGSYVENEHERKKAYISYTEALADLASLRAIKTAAREYLDLVIDRKGTVGDQIQIVAALRAALAAKS